MPDQADNQENSSLGNIFRPVPDKDQAWQNILKQVSENDSYARWEVTSTLGKIFSLVPDKDQAWQDLHRLTKDEDGLVRMIAAEALGQALHKAELYSFLSSISLGSDVEDSPLQRFIPVRVYLPEGNPNEVVLVNKVLETIFNMLDVSVSDDFPAETGSWFKRLFVKTSEAITQPEVTERLQKIERSLELHGLHQPQSQVDKNEAEAVSIIISSLEKIPSAVIQVGSLVVIKSSDSQNDPHLLVRSLSQQEMIYLEKNQHLLKSPQELFSKLSEVKIETNRLLLSVNDGAHIETNSSAENT